MKRLKDIIFKIFAVIGVLSSCITFYDKINYFQNKEYKKENEITIYNYDAQNLVKKNSLDKIKIYYQNELIENLYNKFLTIKNTGKKPIEPNGYIENICIKTDGEKILDLQLISYSNSYIKKNINEKTIIEESKVCFPNILLNPDDYFQINIITSKFPKNIEVGGVIFGIDKFEINSDNTYNYKIGKLRKMFSIIKDLYIIFIILIIILFFMQYIMHRKMTNKFTKKFQCNKNISKLFSMYYYTRIKSIKKNSTNKEKDLKMIDNEMKKCIDELNDN